MALVEIEAPTLLIGKERLDPGASTIPVTGFVCVRPVGEEIDWLVVAFPPPANRMHRSVSLIAECHLGQTKPCAWFERERFKSKFVIVAAQNDVFGGAARSA